MRAGQRRADLGFSPFPSSGSAGTSRREGRDGGRGSDGECGRGLATAAGVQSVCPLCSAAVLLLGPARSPRPPRTLWSSRRRRATRPPRRNRQSRCSGREGDSRLLTVVTSDVRVCQEIRVRVPVCVCARVCPPGLVYGDVQARRQAVSASSRPLTRSSPHTRLGKAATPAPPLPVTAGLLTCLSSRCACGRRTATTVSPPRPGAVGRELVECSARSCCSRHCRDHHVSSAG